MLTGLDDKDGRVFFLFLFFFSLHNFDRFHPRVAVRVAAMSKLLLLLLLAIALFAIVDPSVTQTASTRTNGTTVNSGLPCFFLLRRRSTTGRARRITLDQSTASERLRFACATECVRVQSVCRSAAQRSAAVWPSVGWMLAVAAPSLSRRTR